MQQEIGVIHGRFAQADATFTGQRYAFLVKEHLGLVVIDAAAIGAVVDKYVFATIAFDFAMLARCLLPVACCDGMIR